MVGRQVRLFFVNGTVGGLTTAEITNWTGHVLSGPRSDLASLLGRDEVKRTGVYLLLGDDEEAVGGIRCYVGEGDVVGDRLRHHVREKEFWDRVIIITSKDANLTKAHGRYLESKLIELARATGRVTVENGTTPPAPPLPEADRSDMDEFLAYVQIVLPAIGVNAIRGRAAQSGSLTLAIAADSPTFSLVDKKAGVDARARMIDGEFTVLAESSVVARWTREGGMVSTMKSYAAYRAHHQRLIDEGVIAVDHDTARMTRDHVFTSPSAAGAILVGRSCNGRKEWVSAQGQTFGGWEDRDIPR